MSIVDNSITHQLHMKQSHKESVIPINHHSPNELYPITVVTVYNKSKPTDRQKK